MSYNNDTMAEFCEASVSQARQSAIHAEGAVIGGIMLDNSMYDEVAGIIAIEDFFLETHRTIYSAIVELAERNSPMDVVTMACYLEERGLQERAGGMPYLGTLLQDTPTAANVPTYARKVRDLAALRRLAAACGRGQAEALNPGGRDPGELAADIEAQVFQSIERRDTGGLRHVRVFLTGTLEEIDRRAAGESTFRVSTGLTDLDRQIGGMEPGQLVLIGARPSMGKSALAMTIALHVSQVEQLPVAFFSLEMSAAELTERALSKMARVPLARIRSGKADQDQFAALASASVQLRAGRLLLDDTGAVSVADLRAKCRRLKRQQGSVGLVVVDYLQLMQSERKTENRVAELSVISRGLKMLAKEIGAPVIALSQLNRSCEARVNRRPVLSDLRESGSLEQDADTVCFIYRDEVYNPESTGAGTAEIILAKNRNGPAGSFVRLAFQGAYCAFDNLAMMKQTEVNF